MKIRTIKQISLSLAVTTAMAIGSFNASAQGMAVNTTGATANASAALDVSSTSQGVLVPRMTAAQRGLISSPATGLLVYQTDGTSGFYFYNGAAWTSLSAISGSAGGGLTGTYPNPTIATGAVGIAQLSATGTASSSTYLRGDNTWATPAGGGSTGITTITAPISLPDASAEYLANGAGNITLPASPSTGTNIYIIGTTFGLYINMNGKNAIDPTGWVGSGYLFTITAGTRRLTPSNSTTYDAYFVGSARFIYNGSVWVYIPY